MPSFTISVTSAIGHLFQNRYKSVLCQEDAYLLELVRYIHFNPLVPVLLPISRNWSVLPIAATVL